MKPVVPAPFWEPAEYANTEAFTRSSPKILWIELTSKCPLHCVFCSRELVRGKGQHLDFKLYERLIGDLSDTDVIRLNYSGESAHYPQLIEAIELASSTGARTELVTALVSMSDRVVERLAKSPLDLLTISLHTLDPNQYKYVYKIGELSTLLHKLELLQSGVAQNNNHSLELDFGFVAMDSNLSQLPALAGFAREQKIKQINICPVVRRDPIEEPFYFELGYDSVSNHLGKLTPEFSKKLSSQLQETQKCYPEVAMHLTNALDSAGYTLSTVPQYFLGKLPAYARISGCDQDPWSTAHVLADGSVMSCEVRDQIPLGNLHTQGFSEIWHGDAYQQFRKQFVHGNDPKCQQCAWKKAWIPSVLGQQITPHKNTSQLLQGWHHAEGSIIWSQASAHVILSASSQQPDIRITGVLPPAPEGTNTMMVLHNEVEIAAHQNRTNEMEEFSLACNLELDDNISSFMINLVVTNPLRPSKTSDSEDIRVLGFAMSCIEVME